MNADPNQVKVLRDAKGIGWSRARARKYVRAKAKDTAASQGWRPSELAMTLAQWDRSIEEVFGKEAKP